MPRYSENIITPRLAYSVDEYCDAHGICRGSLYNLWRRGDGPKRMKLGSRTLISVEAADAYRRQCEAATADAA